MYKWGKAAQGGKVICHSHTAKQVQGQGWGAGGELVGGLERRGSSTQTCCALFLRQHTAFALQ